MGSRGGPGRRARSAASTRGIELRTVQEEDQFRRDLEEVNVTCFHIRLFNRLATVHYLFLFYLERGFTQLNTECHLIL